jgi:hypothetical protein
MQMKTMKAFGVVGSFALALCFLVPAVAQQVNKVRVAKKAPAPQIQGVTALTTHTINGNRDHYTKLSTRANELIKINWALKASPPTTSVSVSSTNPAVVQPGRVVYLDNVNGPNGPAGDIQATFLSRKKGQATLTFIIRRGKEFSTVKSDVEVK